MRNSVHFLIKTREPPILNRTLEATALGEHFRQKSGREAGKVRSVQTLRGEPPGSRWPLRTEPGRESYGADPVRLREN